MRERDRETERVGERGERAERGRVRETDRGERWATAQVQRLLYLEDYPRFHRFGRIYEDHLVTLPVFRCRIDN